MTASRISQTRQVIERSLEFVQGDTVDLGAGTAKYRGLIIPKSRSYTTFDMSEGPNIDVVGDILNLPFSDGSFDTAISTQVLEHVKKPWVVASEIYRILRPGGVAIISAPFLISYHADPDDYFRYTIPGIRSLFESFGFEAIECNSYGGTFASISEIIHFMFFSPYEKKGRSKTRQYIFSKLQKIFFFLDRFSDGKTVYANVYIIARKPK